MQTDKTTNSTLGEFFITSLQEIYWSEIHLINVLSTMTDAASTEELKQAFEMHREQTREHVERLEEVFSLLGVVAEPEPSIGLQGLFDEGWQVIDETETGSAQRDAALIIASQKVEHYEIACYGSLRTLAKTLGRKDIAKILERTLKEEKETDALLTEIAERDINEEASAEPAYSYQRSIE
jgi:ferritin-like metal-binding protein YciE